MSFSAFVFLLRERNLWHVRRRRDPVIKSGGTFLKRHAPLSEPITRALQFSSKTMRSDAPTNQCQKTSPDTADKSTLAKPTKRTWTIDDKSIVACAFSIEPQALWWKRMVVMHSFSFLPCGKISSCMLKKVTKNNRTTDLRILRPILFFFGNVWSVHPWLFR